MKRSIIAISSVLFLALSSITFANSLNSLSKSQVNEQLNDKTITTIPLVTISGSMTNNTFTGYFGNQGKLEGHMASKPENDPINDTGTWTIKSNGTLCATWQHWNNSKPICVSVYKVNNGLLFINNESHKLETIVLDTNIKTGNQLG